MEREGERESDECQRPCQSDGHLSLPAVTAGEFPQCSTQKAQEPKKQQQKNPTHCVFEKVKGYDWNLDFIQAT